MNIHRLSGTAAFLCLTLVGTICLAQKDLNPNDPVISDAEVEKPEKPAASVSSEADRDSVASITLKKLDPVQVTNTLRNLFVKEGSHTPSIEADEEHRKIIVRGTEEEINQVRTILRELGETTASEELQRLKKLTLPNGARSPSGAHSGPPSNRIEGLDVLLIETKDGLSAYSKSLGKWDQVVVGLPQNGRRRLQNATVSQNFASVVIDDQLFGFSGKSGRWGRLKIPQEFIGKIGPIHGMNMLSVDIGDQTYALSPTSGEWISSRDQESPSAQSHGNDGTIRDAEQKLGLAIDSPDTRRLKSEIQKLEEQSKALVSKIQASSKGEDGKDSATQESQAMRKELYAILGQAFDSKNDLEHVRIKELLMRLGQLEQQIGRRQALRSQIIERRTRELIDGEQTKWNEELQSRASRGIPDVVREQTPDDVARVDKLPSGIPANEIRVKFATAGLDQEHVLKVNSRAEPLRLPAKLDVCWNGTEIHRQSLKLVRLKPHFYSRPLLLETYPLNRNTAFYLKEDDVPFTFSAEECGPERLKETITKVAYVPDARLGELAVTEMLTVISTRLDSGIDPVIEADKRGTIIAVLRLLPIEEKTLGITKSPDTNGVRSSSNPFDSSATDESVGGLPGGTEDPSAKRDFRGANLSALAGQASLLPYKEIANGILNSLDELEHAKTEYSRLEKLWQNKVVSASEYNSAKRSLDLAIGRLKIVQDDYRGTMRDLELQLKEATAESERADKALQRYLELKRSGSVSGGKVNEAEREVEKANSSIERLKARYDLYKQAGEMLPEIKKPAVLTQEQTDAIEIPWGLKLATSPVTEHPLLGDKTHRSGLRIIHVAEGSVAASQGLQKDDILVELDDSETPSADVLVEILRKLEERVRLESQRYKVPPTKKVKIVFIRATSMLQGQLLIQPGISAKLSEPQTPTNSPVNESPFEEPPK